MATEQVPLLPGRALGAYGRRVGQEALIGPRGAALAQEIDSHSREFLGWGSVRSSFDQSAAGQDFERNWRAHRIDEARPAPTSTANLISQVSRLPVLERHRVLNAVLQSFGAEALPLRVEKTDDVSGGEACLVRTRIPVWVLESYRRQGWTDDDLLANYPTLRKPDLASAWLYVEAFGQEIEEAIRANEAD